MSHGKFDREAAPIFLLFILSLRRCLLQPLFPSSVLPESQTTVALLCGVVTFTVLFALLPEPFVPPPVCPGELPEPVFSVVVVLSLVLPPVVPLVDSRPVHHAAFPLAFKLPPVLPDVQPGSVDLVLRPLSPIFRTVSPVVYASSLLLSELEVSFKPASFAPLLYTNTVLQVVHPLALIGRLVFVIVDAVPMGNVLLPLSNIDIPVGVRETTKSLGSVGHPLALERRPVLPPLSPETPPLVPFPLSCVGGACGKLVCRSGLDGVGVCVWHSCHFFAFPLEVVEGV
mmetsp:Transcript_28618/g.56042  ORF Transcript_28618/g.56042 Transcript_28618/m.56042 type:complete len:285 (+) Transcript_28618:971-1825(+)